jgi:hypothetical protein
MNLSFLLWFWLAAAPDPWRGVAPNIARIVQADRNQVALKEPAQIIAAAIEAELDTTPIDRGFHLGRAAERERHVRTAGGLLGGHDAFQTKCCMTKRNAAQLAAAIAPIKVTCRAITFQIRLDSRSRTKVRISLIALLMAFSTSALVAGLSESSLI